MTVNQIRADNRRMMRFIGDRISPDGTTRIVLANGGDGPGWVDLTPLWDDAGDCDLVTETNEPDAFGLRDVYEHFRRKEMTGWEWEREWAAELSRWKVHDSERENAAMGHELSEIRQTTLEMNPQMRFIQSERLNLLTETQRIADALERIANKMDQEQPAVDSPYLDANQTASYLKRTLPAIYNLVRRGRLHPLPGSRKLTFEKKELDNFLKKSR